MKRCAIRISSLPNNCSGDAGLETARQLGCEIAIVGAVLVTGFAEGFDSAAATGALSEGGTVLAVLGAGTDDANPAKNTQLQRQVAEQGALVSEYLPGTCGSRITFPQRNRIISGLSTGVTIVEAPARCGSRITAARAQEQGRDVFVAPGGLNDRSFIGSNELICDGAQMIRGAADILEAYRFRSAEWRPLPRKKLQPRKDPPEKAPLTIRQR